MRIVFIQTAFLGDLLLSVPALKRIKTLYPDCELNLVCRSGLGSLMKDLKLVDYFHEIKKGDQSSYKKLKDKLTKVDLVISAHQSFRTGLLVRSLRSKRSIGFKNWWSWLFYDETVEFDTNLHDALRQLSLVGPLPSSNKNAGNFPSLVPVSHNPKFKNLEKVFLIYPGSVWATKRWTTEGFKAVAEWLLGQGLTPILMGSPEERELCEEIRNGNPKILNYAGSLTLFENIQLISQSQGVLCNDNGGQHLASLTEVPILSIFGPTSIEFGYRAWSYSGQVIQNKLPCSPCGPHGHKQCPLGHHKCMKDLSPGMVIGKLKDLVPLKG